MANFLRSIARSALNLISDVRSIVSSVFYSEEIPLGPDNTAQLVVYQEARIVRVFEEEPIHFQPVPEPAEIELGPVNPEEPVNLIYPDEELEYITRLNHPAEGFSDRFAFRIGPNQTGNAVEGTLFPYYYPNLFMFDTYWLNKFNYPDFQRRYPLNDQLRWREENIFGNIIRRLNSRNIADIIDEIGHAMQRSIYNNPSITRNTRYYIRIQVTVISPDPMIPPEDRDIQSNYLYPYQAVSYIIRKLLYFLFRYETITEIRNGFIGKMYAPNIYHGETKLSEYVIERQIDERKFVIINMDTKTNCVYDSIAVGLNILKNHKKCFTNSDRCSLGSILKESLKGKLKSREINPSILENVTEDIISMIACVNKIKINIMTELCEVVDSYGDLKDNGEVNLILSNNHCKVSIPSEYLDKTIIKKLKESKPKKGQEMFKILKREKVRNQRYLAYDFETLNDEGNTEDYCAGHAYHEGFNDKGEIIFVQFYGYKTAIKDYLRHVLNNIDLYRNCVFYSYNGAKFDLKLAIKYMGDIPEIEYINDKMIDQDGAITCFSIAYKGKVIHFKDLYKLVGTGNSLRSIAKDLKVPTQKGDIDHSKVNIITYIEMRDEIKKYHKSDCIATLQVADYLSEASFSDSGINITNCATGASLARKDFLTNGLKCHHNLAVLDDYQDKYVRVSYKGGRTEAFIKGIKYNQYKYDITSSYPNQCQYMLPTCPTDELIDLKGKSMEEALQIANFGFMTVMARGTKEMLSGRKPYLGIEKDFKYMFAYIDTWTEMRLSVFEITTAMSVGYKFFPIDCIPFEGGYPFRDYIRKVFNERKQAKKEKKKAVSLMKKIYANSTYGWPGTNKRGKVGVNIISNKRNDWIVPFMNGELKDIQVFENRTIYIDEKDVKGLKTNVAISAVIAARARWHLYNIVCDIESEGGIVIYLDTDSVECNIDMMKHPNLIKKYRSKPDGSIDHFGEELGNLKSEYGMLSFTQDNYNESITILGLKLYGEKFHKRYISDLGEMEKNSESFMKQFNEDVLKLDEDGEEHHESYHMKGYSQRDKTVEEIRENFEKMANGESIFTSNLVFHNPRTSILKGKSMTQGDTVKSFKSLYTKGTINEMVNGETYQKIEPFTIGIDI